MSNLIPEKRLDKNGVLTTKHVRSTPRSSASSSLLGTAPKLASSTPPAKAYKPVTKAQQKAKPRVITASLHHPDTQLTESLGIDNGLGIYRFNASDEQFYDVLSVTSKGNALAFLYSGTKNADDATGYLMDNGLEHLLQDNTDLAMQARERRMNPDIFLTHTRKASDDELADPCFWDSIEVLGSPILSHCDGLSRDVLVGNIRLEDVKTIGTTRISKSVGWHVISDGLKRIANDDANYTAEDMKKVVEKYGDESDSCIENALSLCDQYDVDFATSLYSPSLYAMVLNDDLRDIGTPPERAKSIIKYHDDLEREGGAKNAEFAPTIENLIRFHDANVSPADAYHGRVTLSQLDAIEEHGISSSMSSGWL